MKFLDMTMQIQPCYVADKLLKSHSNPNIHEQKAAYKEFQQSFEVQTTRVQIRTNGALLQFNLMAPF
jgi:hypothetical protein